MKRFLKNQEIKKKGEKKKKKTGKIREKIAEKITFKMNNIFSNVLFFYCKILYFRLIRLVYYFRKNRIRIRIN